MRTHTQVVVEGVTAHQADQRVAALLQVGETARHRHVAA